MRELLVMDEMNYTEDMPILERRGVRAIIKKGDKYAMQQGSDGYFKIPGGGMEGDETFSDTIFREVLEETGLTIIKNSIIELGEIIELREDLFTKGIKFIAHSYFFSCKVEDEIHELHLTKSEIEKGYKLVWATAEEIYNNNLPLAKEFWAKRDTSFIKLLLDGEVVV